MNHATPNLATLCFDIMPTPVGRLRLIADDIGLRRICF